MLRQLLHAMRMLLRALLATIFVSFIQAEKNITDDVQAFIAKYRQFNEIPDILEGFDKIGEHNMELYKLGQPIRALIRKGVNLTEKFEIVEHTSRNHHYKYNVSTRFVEAENEEGRALLQLRSLFNISEMFGLTSSSLYGMYIFSEYNHVSAQKLAHSMNDIGEYLGEEKHMSRIKQLRNGPGEFDPLRLLVRMDEYTRQNCRLTDKQEITRYAQAKEIFRRLVARGLPERSNPMSADNAIHIIPAIMHASDDFISELEREMDTLEPTVEALSGSKSYSDLLQNLYLHPDEYKCLLDMSNMEHAFNQTSMYNTLHYLYRDLLRIELSNWALSSVIEPDEESYFNDGEVATLPLKRTGKFIAKWIRAFENVSWPEIGIQAAKDAIGNETILIESFNETARVVQKIFGDYGSQSYAYQVLVVPTSEVNVSWTVGTVGNGSYSNITDINGVDIHIFRYNRTDSVGRALHAKKWIQEKKNDLVKTLSNNALNNLSTTLTRMQDDNSVDSIYGDNLYRSVILMKKTETDTKTATFPVGSATFENASFKLEASTISYSVLENGKEYLSLSKAFFFL